MNEDGLVQSLVAASIHGGLFVLAVGLVGVTFRRLPPWVRAWLWWIACAQFLVRLFLTVPIPVPVPVAAPVPVASTFTRVPVRTTVIPETVVAVTQRPVAATTPTLSLEAILAILWVLGVMVGTTIAGRRLLGARRLIQDARPVEGSAAAEILQELVGSGRPMPRLLESPGVKCPLLTGYFRPAIVMPAGFASTLPPDEIRMALAHEVAHLRRRDQWLSLVVASVQILFFFHPIVWLAAREASLSREEACDLDALRLSGANPASYAHFLVKSAQGRTPVAALGAAYGYRNLRRRISMLKIANPASVPPRSHLWKMLIAAGIGAALPWSVVAQSSPQAAAKSPVAERVKPAIASKPIKSNIKSVKKKPAPVAVKPAKASQAARVKPARAAADPIAVPSAAPALAVPYEVTRAASTAPAHAMPAQVRPSHSRSVNTAPVPGTEAVTAAVPATTQLPGMPGEIAAMPAATMPSPVADSAPAMVMDSPFGSRNTLQITVDKASSESPLERKVTAKLVGADLETALVKLLSEAGHDFVIKGGLQPQGITCGFTNAPVIDVLKAILSGAEQELTYRFEGGVIFITPRSKG